jgi:hypothetical protein
VANDIDHERRRFLSAAAMTIVDAHVATLGTAEAAPREPRELAALGHANEWLNSPRLTPESLSGKVVLVDFWTYTCINWLRAAVDQYDRPIDATPSTLCNRTCQQAIEGVPRVQHMHQQIDVDRRRFLSAAAAAIAAARLAAVGASGAQSAGTATFGELKQIDAGVLNIGYAALGPPHGGAVVLLHGWPYDIHSYVDVAPLLASAWLRDDAFSVL